jgi:hypothetical protein
MSFSYHLHRVHVNSHKVIINEWIKSPRTPVTRTSGSQLRDPVPRKLHLKDKRSFRRASDPSLQPSLMPRRARHTRRSESWNRLSQGRLRSGVGKRDRDLVCVSLYAFRSIWLMRKGCRICRARKVRLVSRYTYVYCSTNNIFVKGEM